MIVSTKGRYALRVIIDMAEHPNDGYIPLKDIAKRQEISEKYLESILKLLVKGKLVTGLRGKGGGYRLNQAPHSCTVGSILRLTEDTLAPVSCLAEDAAPCPRSVHCRTLPMWQKLDSMIQNYLDSVTISDLMENGTAGDDYVI